VVTRAYATSPLRLLAPSNHGNAAWVFTSTYGGGLVGGDAASLSVDVGRRASALLQTQSSTKVYRSPLGASSALQARVEEHACLLVLPDPTVCFAGATFAQAQHFDVRAGASLVLMDWLTSGRRAAAERWAFDRYASRTTVLYDGTLVLSDAMLLTADDGPLAERMGRFDCLCTIVMVGPEGAEPSARALAKVAHTDTTVRADVLIAAAPLANAGCVIRMAGMSVEEVGRIARTFLSFVPGLLGDNPWARKW
jgi:urease accessory protein